MYLMLLECFYCHTWQRNVTPTRSCFRLSLIVTKPFHRVHSTPYMQYALYKINITPSQREQFRPRCDNMPTTLLKKGDTQPGIVYNVVSRRGSYKETPFP